MPTVKKAAIPTINVSDRNLHGILQPMKERIEEHIESIATLQNQLLALQSKVNAPKS